MNSTRGMMLSVGTKLFLLLPMIASTSCTNSTADKNLTFLYLTGFTGVFLSSGSIPAVEMALETINNDPSLLPGYKLQFVARDAQCSRYPSLRSFLDYVINNETTVIAILGAGCTTASEPVAEISPNYGLSQVSFVTSGTVLTNLDIFFNLIQVHSPERNNMPGLAKTIKLFNWTRLVILSEDNIFFTTNQKQLQDLLVNATIKIRLFEESHRGPFHLEELQNDGYRIFFINGYEDMGLHIICEAYNLNMVPPEYVWILYGWYQAEFWTNTSALNLTCSSEELYKVIDNAIVTSHYPIAENRSTKARDVGNISYNDFQTIYRERLQNSSYRYGFFAHIAYDAAWVLAFGLNKTISMISENASLPPECSGYNTPLVSSLTEFTYTNSSTACLIRHNLFRVSFTGISGSVQFDMNGTRNNTPVRILQYRSGKPIHIGSYFGFSDTFRFQTGENTTTVYPNGTPKDGSPVKIILTFHIALVIIIYTLTFLGIVFAIVCFIFNLMFNKKKVVRLTSPKLNYFIILGAIMIYTAIIFRVLPSNNIIVWRFICTVPVWLGNIGYTLAFAAILSKMWRIYYIFHNPAPKKRAISDWHMIILIFIIAIGMAVIIAVGFAIPQVLPSPVLVNDTEHRSGFNELDMFLQYKSYQCLSSASIPWQIIIFVYLGGLHIIAIILAVQTRKVKVKALNETKEVTAIIYISSIILVVLISVSFTVTQFKNISEACITTGLLTVTTSFLIANFAPKMWKLYKDPNYDEKNKNSSDFNTSQHVTECSKIAMLESKIKTLESQLNKHLNRSSLSAGNGGTMLDSHAE